MRSPEPISSGRTETDADEDTRLMQTAARGDATALSALYDRHAPVLLAVAQRIVGRGREAEDLLHDVFVEAWRHAADYDRARGTVKAWLLLRMRSRALDRKRAEGRSKVVLAPDGQAPEVADAGQDPSLAPDRAVVRRALAALAGDQREVLTLAYFDGLTSSEIATHLGIPIGTVKSRVARALAQLRLLLGEEGGRDR